MPRQLVEVPYVYTNREAILRCPITTGAAAGQSVSDCVTSWIVRSCRTGHIHTCMANECRPQAA